MPSQTALGSPSKRSADGARGITTNGMVERFSGRISQILRTNRFASSHEMADALERYRNVYKHHVAQRALNHKTPQEMMPNWYQRKPEIFLQDPTRVPGLNIQRRPAD
ncbi:MAG: hypothetical protein ACFCU4_01915 [Puniceicoccaceae bacterium]